MWMLNEKPFYIFLYPNNETVAIPAALALFERNGSLRVSYGKKYRERNNCEPIDPVLLPLYIKENILEEGCYGTIRDASLDYWGRLVISRMHKQDVNSLTEVDFLLYNHLEGIGNLDFRDSLQRDEADIKQPMTEHLDILLNVARNIELGRDVDKRHLMLLVQGTGLGGSRPKCTIIHEGFPWLAKLPSVRDTYSNARVEMATMMLAKECGITVPEMQLLEVNGSDILLLKRFDRKHSKEGISRLGYMSALSICRTNEHDIFAYSYENIAGEMSRYCPSDVKEFFKRMVFNVLCRNTDDHPRNHGFLIENGDMRLSPAFDITPTPSVEGISTYVTQAMNVGEFGKVGSLDNIFSHAVKFGINNDEAHSIVEEMLQDISQWENVFEECGVKEEEVELFRYSFERWNDNTFDDGNFISP